MRAGKEEEMWDSVQILCKEQSDGSLTVEVLVCHPDWEEAKTIAAIHSRPQDDGTAAPSLKCDLQPSGPGGMHRASGPPPPPTHPTHHPPSPPIAPLPTSHPPPPHPLPPPPPPPIPPTP